MNLIPYNLNQTGGTDQWDKALPLGNGRLGVLLYGTDTIRLSLDEAGCDVKLIRVEGSDHEGDFWSDELHDIVLEFIDRHMKK